MRPLIAIALVLAAACGREDRRDTPDAHDAPSAPQSRAPDALVLRVPRAGGMARVVAYPRLDSVVWTANEALPALERILAFDDDAGVIAAVDSRGRPVRLELRAGSVTRLASAALESPGSANADAVYGIEKGSVIRLTPAGRWSFKPPRDAEGAYPRPDGSLFVLGNRGGASILWRLRPPETRIVDSVLLPEVQRALPAPGADRLYFAVEGGLASVHGRTLDTSVVAMASIRDLVTTPSGDRLFVLTDTEDQITVVDRYRDRIERQIALPGPARAVRMDPVGRYLLVRMAEQDSAWIVAIGTRKVIGAVRTGWRTDLPFVAADGAVGLVQGDDVVWVDGETLRQSARVDGGASDFWFAFRWNGFRPRDPSLDQPVSFGGPDTMPVAGADSGATAHDTVATRADTATAPPAPTGWSVSFAALLNEERARALASSIRVGGQAARVLTSNRDGASVYRVVLGPYGSREEAEHAARESKQTSYWIYEGTP